MGSLIFTLPKPPSTNHIYGYSARGGHARSYITAEGKAWFEEAGYIVNIQNKGKKMLSCHLGFEVNLYTAYYTIQDIDGILKPTLDLFQKQGVIENDNLILDLHVHKYKTTKDKERVEVTITTLD